MKLELGVLRNSIKRTVSDFHVPAFVRNLLEDIGEKHGLRNRTMQFEVGSNPGDGFTSKIFRAIISEEDSDKNLRLVYKLAPENKMKNLPTEFNSNFTFTNEAHFYKSVMPTFVDFQVEKRVPKDSRFKLIPKCFAAVANESKNEYALIFEDLNSKGFSMYSRSKPSRVENIRFALNEIAKFHAISIAMKDQQPDRFARLRQYPNIYKQFLETPNLLPMFETSFDRSISVLHSEEHKDIYREIRETSRAHFVDCLDEQVNDEFGVMCHGDLWTNNCLYKFENNVSPLSVPFDLEPINDREKKNFILQSDIATDMRILDWQTLGYITPALDVVFNVFLSTDKRLRDSEFHNLVHSYHQTLSQTVKLYGSNAEKLFTFNDLQAEIQRIGQFMLLVAPHYMQLAQASSTELAKWNENMPDGEQPELYTILSKEAKRTYGEKINEIVGDIVQRGYYRKLKSN